MTNFTDKSWTHHPKFVEINIYLIWKIIIRSQFCTWHNSWAVVPCAKWWPDWTIRIKIIAKWNFSHKLINYWWKIDPGWFEMCRCWNSLFNSTGIPNEGLIKSTPACCLGRCNLSLPKILSRNGLIIFRANKIFCLLHGDILCRQNIMSGFVKNKILNDILWLLSFDISLKFNPSVIIRVSFMIRLLCWDMEHLLGFQNITYIWSLQSKYDGLYSIFLIAAQYPTSYGMFSTWGLCMCKRM